MEAQMWEKRTSAACSAASGVVTLGVQNQAAFGGAHRQLDFTSQQSQQGWELCRFQIAPGPPAAFPSVDKGSSMTGTSNCPCTGTGMGEPAVSFLGFLPFIITFGGRH